METKNRAVECPTQQEQAKLSLLASIFIDGHAPFLYLDTVKSLVLVTIITDIFKAAPGLSPDTGLYTRQTMTSEAPQLLLVWRTRALF